MIKWIVTIFVCVGLWLITDVRAENVFQSALVPLLLVIIVLSVLVSILYKIGILKGEVIPGGGGERSSGFLGGFFGGDSGGGDGGGDGGC